MDRGFYSKANIDQLTLERHHFTIGVPAHLKWVREEIDRFRNAMYGPAGYRKVGEETLYVHTHLAFLGGRQATVLCSVIFQCQGSG